MGEAGVWKSCCLTHTASGEVGQGNDLKNSLFPLLFFLFLSSSGRLLIYFPPQARSSALVSALSPSPSFLRPWPPPRPYTALGIQWQRLPGRRKLHPVPGGGGGEEKSCVSFQSEGAASPATSGCTDRPQVRISGWLASPFPAFTP